MSKTAPTILLSWALLIMEEISSLIFLTCSLSKLSKFIFRISLITKQNHFHNYNGFNEKILGMSDYSSLSECSCNLPNSNKNVDFETFWWLLYGLSHFASWVWFLFSHSRGSIYYFALELENSLVIKLLLQTSPDDIMWCQWVTFQKNLPQRIDIEIYKHLQMHILYLILL